eukprot:tig00021070_g17841.t1
MTAHPHTAAVLLVLSAVLATASAAECKKPKPTNFKPASLPGAFKGMREGCAGFRGGLVSSGAAQGACAGSFPGLVGCPASAALAFQTPPFDTRSDDFLRLLNATLEGQPAAPLELCNANGACVRVGLQFDRESGAVTAFIGPKGAPGEASLDVLGSSLPTEPLIIKDDAGASVALFVAPQCGYPRALAPAGAYGGPGPAGGLICAGAPFRAEAVAEVAPVVADPTAPIALRFLTRYGDAPVRDAGPSGTTDEVLQSGDSLIGPSAGPSGTTDEAAAAAYVRMEVAIMPPGKLPNETACTFSAFLPFDKPDAKELRAGQSELLKAGCAARTAEGLQFDVATFFSQRDEDGVVDAFYAAALSAPAGAFPCYVEERGAGEKGEQTVWGETCLAWLPAAGCKLEDPACPRRNLQRYTERDASGRILSRTYTRRDDDGNVLDVRHFVPQRPGDFSPAWYKGAAPTSSCYLYTSEAEVVEACVPDAALARGFATAGSPRFRARSFSREAGAPGIAVHSLNSTSNTGAIKEGIASEKQPVGEPSSDARVVIDGRPLPAAPASDAELERAYSAPRKIVGGRRLTFAEEALLASGFARVAAASCSQTAKGDEVTETCVSGSVQRVVVLDTEGNPRSQPRYFKAGSAELPKAFPRPSASETPASRFFAQAAAGKPPANRVWCKAESDHVTKAWGAPALAPAGSVLEVCHAPTSEGGVAAVRESLRTSAESVLESYAMSCAGGSACGEAGVGGVRSGSSFHAGSAWTACPPVDWNIADGTWHAGPVGAYRLKTDGRAEFIDNTHMRSACASGAPRKPKPGGTIPPFSGPDCSEDACVAASGSKPAASLAPLANAAILAGADKSAASAARLAYTAGNGGPYCPKNCTGHGTAWRVRVDPLTGEATAAARVRDAKRDRALTAAAKEPFVQPPGTAPESKAEPPFRLFGRGSGEVRAGGDEEGRLFDEASFARGFDDAWSGLDAPLFKDYVAGFVAGAQPAPPPVPADATSSYRGGYEDGARAYKKDPAVQKSAYSGGVESWRRMDEQDEGWYWAGLEAGRRAGGEAGALCDQALEAAMKADPGTVAAAFAAACRAGVLASYRPPVGGGSRYTFDDGRGLDTSSGQAQGRRGLLVGTGGVNGRKHRVKRPPGYAARIGSTDGFSGSGRWHLFDDTAGKEKCSASGRWAFDDAACQDASGAQYDLSLHEGHAAIHEVALDAGDVDFGELERRRARALLLLADAGVDYALSQAGEASFEAGYAAGSKVERQLFARAYKETYLSAPGAADAPPSSWSKATVLPYATNDSPVTWRADLGAVVAASFRRGFGHGLGALGGRPLLPSSYNAGYLRGRLALRSFEEAARAAAAGGDAGLVHLAGLFAPDAYAAGFGPAAVALRAGASYRRGLPHPSFAAIDVASARAGFGAGFAAAVAVDLSPETEKARAAFSVGSSSFDEFQRGMADGLAAGAGELSRAGAEEALAAYRAGFEAGRRRPGEKQPSAVEALAEAQEAARRAHWADQIAASYDAAVEEQLQALTALFGSGEVKPEQADAARGILRRTHWADEIAGTYDAAVEEQLKGLAGALGSSPDKLDEAAKESARAIIRRTHWADEIAGTYDAAVEEQLKGLAGALGSSPDKLDEAAKESARAIIRRTHWAEDIDGAYEDAIEDQMQALMRVGGPGTGLVRPKPGFSGKRASSAYGYGEADTVPWEWSSSSAIYRGRWGEGPPDWSSAPAARTPFATYVEVYNNATARLLAAWAAAVPAPAEGSADPLPDPYAFACGFRDALFLLPPIEKPEAYLAGYSAGFGAEERAYPALAADAATRIGQVRARTPASQLGHRLDEPVFREAYAEGVRKPRKIAARACASKGPCSTSRSRRRLAADGAGTAEVDVPAALAAAASRALGSAQGAATAAGLLRAAAAQFSSALEEIREASARPLVRPAQAIVYGPRPKPRDPLLEKKWPIASVKLNSLLAFNASVEADGGLYPTPPERRLVAAALLLSGGRVAPLRVAQPGAEPTFTEADFADAASPGTVFFRDGSPAQASVVVSPASGLALAPGAAQFTLQLNLSTSLVPNPAEYSAWPSAKTWTWTHSTEAAVSVQIQEGALGVLEGSLTLLSVSAPVGAGASAPAAAGLPTAQVAMASAGAAVAAALAALVAAGAVYRRRRARAAALALGAAVYPGSGAGAKIHNVAMYPGRGPEGDVEAGPAQPSALTFTA